MRKKLITLSATVLSFFPFAANAATTDWVKTEGGKLRLLALAPDQNGTIRGALEIAPDPGWHTYWKAPGSGGVPPQINVQTGGNVTLKSVGFPAPQVFADGHLRDYGYDSTVILPLTFQQTVTGVPSRLAADVFIGLCSQICVPFQASLNLKIAPDEKVHPGEKTLVSVAEASLPEASGNDFGIKSSRISNDGKSVLIKVKLPAGIDPHAATYIVAQRNGDAFAAPKVDTASDGTVTIAAAPSYLPDGKTLKGQALDVLVSAAGRSMETTIKPE